MSRHCRTPIALSLLLLCALLVRAESPVRISSETILERFAVPKGGDALVVPVTVAGKERLFLVDTGCSESVFDISIDLGRPRERVAVNTPTGPAEVQLYNAPRGTLGRLPLKGLGLVGREDLIKLRVAGGYRIEGILGMDFLGRHVLHVDFDKGELLFLKSVPEKCGAALPVRWEAGGIPEVSAKLQGRAECFQIDTGHISQCSGSLETGATRRLLRAEELHKIGTEQAHTFTGRSEKPICQSKSISVAGLAIEAPLFAEDALANRLGLTFWSRFAVTFDFPGRTVYLCEGKRFGQLDRLDQSGLHLVRREGIAIVEQLEGDAPAMKWGFREGDEIVKLGDLNANSTSLFDLRRMLRDGPEATCTVRRNGRVLELTLPSRQ
jgi:hypothetical protein